MAIRNEAFSVFFEAFDSAGDPLVNSPSDITTNLYQDGSPTSTALGNPTHLEANVYRYDLTAANMDADSVAIVPIVASDGYANKIFIMTDRGLTNDAITTLDEIDGKVPELAVLGSVDSVTDAGIFIGATGLSATDDFYNDMILAFVSGDLKGINRPVISYTGSTREFTVSPEFPAQPQASDEFVLIGRFI